MRVCVWRKLLTLIVFISACGGGGGGDGHGVTQPPVRVDGCSANDSDCTFTLSGSASSDTSNGISAIKLFSDQDTSSQSGNLSININSLSSDVNSDGSGHGISVDGNDSRSRVDGNITINNQSGKTTYVKGWAASSSNATHVSNMNAAAIFGRSRKDITIHNKNDLVFKPNGNRFNDGLVGLYAESMGGNVLVKNYRHTCIGLCWISISDFPINLRGSKQTGILVNNSSGTGSIRIDNDGGYLINTQTSDASSYGIYVNGGNASSITIDNKGQISTSGAIFYVRGSGSGVVNITNNAQINGSVLYDTSDYDSGPVNVHLRGNVSTGSIKGGDGNDTVTVHNGATLRLMGSADFGAGNDTINNYGRLGLGGESQKSNTVTITGMNNFNLRSGSTLDLHISRTGNAFNKISIATTLNLYGDLLSGSPIFNIHLPSNYTFSREESAFDLLDVTSITKQGTAANLATIFARMSESLALFQGGRRISLAGIPVTFATKTNDASILTVSWYLPPADASSLNCYEGLRRYICEDGSLTGTGGLNNGIKSTEIFKKLSAPSDISIDEDGIDGEFEIRISETVGDVNASGTGHGVEINGYHLQSAITGEIDFHFFNDSFKTFVRGDGIVTRGMDAAAVFIKSRQVADPWIDTNLEFDHSGSSFNNGLVGIYADGGSGRVDIRVDDVRIGFAANETVTGSNRGMAHRGIFVKAKGSRETRVRLWGTIIDVRGGGTNSHGIYLDYDSTKEVIIRNGGEIYASGDIFHYGTTSGTADIYFAQPDGTSIKSYGGITTRGGNDKLVFWRDSSITLTSMNLGGGNDIIANQGLINFLGGTGVTHAFGSGDNIISNYGTIAFGNATNTSDKVTISGLDRFNMTIDSTLRFYLSRTNNAFNPIRMGGAFYLDAGFWGGAPILELHLPANYTAPETLASFNLFHARFQLNYRDRVTLQTVAARMSSSLRLFDSAGNVITRKITLTFGNNVIALSWQPMLVAANSNFTCRYISSSKKVDCLSGKMGTGTGGLGNGIDGQGIFSAASITSSITGDLTININNLGHHVNSSGTNHGVTMDGTIGSSRVTGNITLNNQTSTDATNKKTVFVTGNGTASGGLDAAALFVKSSADAKVVNHSNLEFEHSGTSFNNSLAGIYAESGNNGKIEIDNYSRIGFSKNESVTKANRGTGHRGIFVKRSGSGTTTINNRSEKANLSEQYVYGVVDARGNTSSHAIYIEGGTGAVTINNHGSLLASDDIIHYGDSAGTAAITLNQKARYTAVTRGGITTRGGDDRINIEYRGYLALTSVDMGSGHDVIDSKGRLFLGDASNPSNNITFSGVEALNVHDLSTLGLYLSHTGSAFNKIEIDTDLTLYYEQDRPIYLEINLPSNYTLQTNESAFDLLDVESITAGDTGSGDSLATVLSRMGRSVTLFGNDGGGIKGDFTLAEKSGNDKIITLGWRNASRIPDGYLNGKPESDDIFTWCHYDSTGGGHSHIAYASQSFNGRNRCTSSNLFNNGNYSSHHYNPRIPFSGQFLHGLLGSNRTISNPDRVTILDTFNAEVDPTDTLTRYEPTHGGRVRRYFFEESFFSTPADLRALDFCDVDNPGGGRTRNPGARYIGSISGCFDAEKRKGKGRIISASFLTSSPPICTDDAMEHDWIIVQGAGNTYERDAFTGLAKCNGSSPEDWKKWEDSYRLLLITEMEFVNDNLIRRIGHGSYCGSITKKRCVGAFSPSDGNGSSFTTPQVAAMLQNLYAV